MESNDPLDQPLPTDRWISFLKDGIAAPDLDDEGIRSFLFHLADLGILEMKGEGMWGLCGLDLGQPRQQIRKDLMRRLETLSRTEPGFAVACFLGRNPVETSPGLFGETETKKSGGTAGPEISSDLSNLQIVKKVGRQLQPFLELEKKFLSRLQGTHTGKDDAQRIFHYIFSKTRQKAKPRKWEQLSRKRHK